MWSNRFKARTISLMVEGISATAEYQRLGMQIQNSLSLQFLTCISTLTSKNYFFHPSSLILLDVIRWKSNEINFDVSTSAGWSGQISVVSSWTSSHTWERNWGRIQIRHSSWVQFLSPFWTILPFSASTTCTRRKIRDSNSIWDKRKKLFLELDSLCVFLIRKSEFIKMHFYLFLGYFAYSFY